MDLRGVEPRSILVPRAAFQDVETFQTLSVVAGFEPTLPYNRGPPEPTTNPPTRRRVLERLAEVPLTELPRTPILPKAPGNYSIASHVVGNRTVIPGSHSGLPSPDLRLFES